MSKKENKIVPKYSWVEEDGVDEVSPSKRKIAKTMEVTETFSYYDALAYCMRMEKEVENKLAEIEGLNSMIKAYRDELEIIDKELNVNEFDKEWNLELHKKLKAEEESQSIESPYGKTENN